MKNKRGFIGGGFFLDLISFILIILILGVFIFVAGPIMKVSEFAAGEFTGNDEDFFEYMEKDFVRLQEAEVKVALDGNVSNLNLEVENE